MPYPPPADFLELQVVTLRDRAEAKQRLPAKLDVHVRLARILDELADASILLQRPTRTNREGVVLMVSRLRRDLDVLDASGPSAAT